MFLYDRLLYLLNNRLYLYFIIIRLIFVLYPSTIIHNDEYYQNIEISAGYILNINHIKTWEWVSNHPIRSIINLYLTSFPVYYLYSFISYIINIITSNINFIEIIIPQYITHNRVFHLLIGYINSYLIYLLPRIIMFIYSILYDIALVIIQQNINQTNKNNDNIYCVIMSSSSWISIILLSRVFSNSIECILLTISLCIATKPYNHTNYFIPVLLFGLLYGFGLFVRFSYIIYAAPLILYLIYQIVVNSCSNNKLLLVTKCISLFLFGCIISIIIVITLDTAYYNKLNGWNNVITVTPYNFLLYNTSSQNVSSHGLHPRWLHLLVNMQIMFGPAFILLLYNLKTILKSKPIAVNVTLISIIGISLLVLSTIPHQEPRFLLPLLPILSLLTANIIMKTNFGWCNSLFIVWLMFNGVCMCVFGLFHQGGIIRSLMYISADINSLNYDSIDVIYYKTYMPPQSLLNWKSDNYKLHDLSHLNHTQLIENINNITVTYMNNNCYNHNCNNLTDKCFIYLLYPASIHQLTSNITHSINSIEMQYYTSFFPHLTLENAPNSIYEMQLKCYCFTIKSTNSKHSS